MKTLLALSLSTLVVPSAFATATPALSDRTSDIRTLQNLESAWLAAEYRGDVLFLDGLLDPGYLVVTLKTKEVRDKAQLLAQVQKNLGKTAEIPPLETVVVVNGDLATAHSRMTGHKKSGEPYVASFVDTYEFRDGSWHAVTGIDL